ncbi:hypothetical protein EI94DRAFT_1785038 [Lactarius quietus]|nr:hypothetical protein EI94DRAFT_1785038 [Lactarius quietus]
MFSTSLADSYRPFFIPSETGSRKSLAYLLPILQDLKATENPRKRSTGPQALQRSSTNALTGTSSAPRLNVANTKARVVAAEMANTFAGEDPKGGFELFEMVHGNGWDKDLREACQRKWVVGRSEISLADVEWVVVDESDVLFHPDFIEQTLFLLSDVAAACGKPVPVISPADPQSKSPVSPATPLDYPFNFILTSTTIPAALASHLDTHHPKTTRLVSPRLHRLPAHLALEFAPYTSGNRNAEVLAKLKTVWRDDALAGRTGGRSRVGLISIRACRMCSCGSLRGIRRTFLHRAGRTAHAGGSEQVVVLGVVAGVERGKSRRCASGSLH